MTDMSYFSRMFKKYTGETCMEFRKNKKAGYPSV